MLHKIPDYLKGSYSHWLANKAAKARTKGLAPGALPPGYSQDRAGRKLRQQLEAELRVVLVKLEQFSNSAAIAASKGEEFAPLLAGLVGDLQNIQEEQAKSKGNQRRLVDLVREKTLALAHSASVKPSQADDFTRQLAAYRARPVKAKEVGVLPADLTTFEQYESWKASRQTQQATTDLMSVFTQLVSNGGNPASLSGELSAKLAQPVVKGKPRGKLAQMVHEKMREGA